MDQRFVHVWKSAGPGRLWRRPRDPASDSQGDRQMTANLDSARPLGRDSGLGAHADQMICAAERLALCAQSGQSALLVERTCAESRGPRGVRRRREATCGGRRRPRTVPPEAREEEGTPLAAEPRRRRDTQTGKRSVHPTHRPTGQGRASALRRRRPRRERRRFWTQWRTTLSGCWR